MPRTIALIDADVLVYRTGLGCEQVIDWGDDIWTLHADFGEARRRLDLAIANIMDEVDADRVEVALSCSTEEGYRRKMFSGYKSNRNNTRKPIVHKPLRDYLMNSFVSYLMPTIEADDVLGILATDPSCEDDRIICSVDKDFQTIPDARFYDLNTKETTTQTAVGATRFFMEQTLSGDSVDGYKGCPTVGSKTAQRLLAKTDDPQEMWEIVVKTFEKQGLTEKDALLNARMARILTWDLWDQEKQEPILWTP